LNPVQDNLCGFFTMKRQTLLTFDLDYIFRGYGEYFIRLVALARRAHLSIREVPVFYTLRKSGESKSRFGSMLRDYTRTTVAIWGYRPK